jgi:cellobiose phosphorylase
MLFLFIHHMLGVRPTESSIAVRPRLLAGLGEVEASLRVRGGRLRLSLRKARRGEKPRFAVCGRDLPYAPEGLIVPFPEDFQTVEISGVLP